MWTATNLLATVILVVTVAHVLMNIMVDSSVYVEEAGLERCANTEKTMTLVFPTLVITINTVLITGTVSGASVLTGMRMHRVMKVTTAGVSPNRLIHRHTDPQRLITEHHHTHRKLHRDRKPVDLLLRGISQLNHRKVHATQIRVKMEEPATNLIMVITTIVFVLSGMTELTVKRTYVLVATFSLFVPTASASVAMVTKEMVTIATKILMFNAIQRSQIQAEHVFQVHVLREVHAFLLR